MKPQPSDGFEWVQAAGGPALVCAALRPLADHLFTTREWPLGSRQEAADQDWQAVAASLGVDTDHLVRVHQVHGASVVVGRAGAGPAPPAARPDADILVSDDRSLVLAVQTADCVPLLIADRVTGAVAAAHAGWRGLAAGVPGVTVAALAREFGSRPADLVAAVGPSICAARYEVGADVRERFSAAGFPSSQLERWLLPGHRPAHWQFDGWRSAQDQLEAAGLAAGHVHVAAMCTASYPDVFCSYRRDGKGAGRIAGAIRRSGTPADGAGTPIRT
jgi:purine-nucleoside/S-methyl-5'-thioadenosine phosphorylase / adenosine deaminase